MAQECTPQEVATSSRYFIGLGERCLLGMMVYLTGQWAKTINPSLDVTPQALANASECYTCSLTWKGLFGAIVYLLCQISGGGGGSPSNGTTNLALSGAMPPTDGSVLTFRVFDTSTGYSWYNSGTLETPTWQSV